MHCRIGCLQTGGFIECFDAAATISIAGTDKNRSRLTDGDVLKIGVLHIEVVIPQANQPTSTFDDLFDDIDSTDTVDAPIETQLEADFFDDVIVNPPVEQDQSEPDFAALVPNSTASPDDFPIDMQSAEADGEQQKDEQTDREEPAASTDDLKTADLENSRSATTSKPVFEFDSVEPDDIKLTEADLNVIENMTGNSLVLHDLDSMVIETFPEHLRHQSVTDETTDARLSETDLSSDHDAIPSGIPSGSDAGKCYRWTGKSVLATVELIEQRDAELQCFDVQENVSLVSCSFAEIKQAITDRAGPRIFLLSEKNPNDLKSFLTANRWNERLGHPQALSMFLTLMPAKFVKLLFAEIDACILVQKSDIELVRLSRDLEK